MNPYAYVNGRVAAAVEPNGEIGLVAGLIVVGVVAALSYAGSVLVQLNTENGDWGDVEYGWGGGQGALAAGVVAGASTAVALAGGYYLGGLGFTGLAGIIVKGAVGGAIGGGVGGGLNAGFQGEGIRGIAAASGQRPAASARRPAQSAVR